MSEPHFMDEINAYHEEIFEARKVCDEFGCNWGEWTFYNGCAFRECKRCHGVNPFGNGGDSIRWQ